MANMNRVMLMGRLTRDPELKHIRKGLSVSDLGLAITEYYTGKDGEKSEKTTFVDVVAWNKQAEVCETYLSKGSTILVEGRLQVDEWEDKDGNPRKKMRVRADRIHFMDTRAKKKTPREEEPVAA